MQTPTLDDRARERFASLDALVGDTPLVEIRGTLGGRDVRVFAKLELGNLTGSIKDRMALRILRDAYVAGEIEPGAPIAEATSGNTGIAFAALGRVLDHPVRIAMPDWMSRERVLLIQSLGASVVPISADQGGFRGAIEDCERFAREHPGTFLPHQFESASNVAAHRDGTGPELVAQLERLGLRPTAFVAGVGTGGTVMGVGHHLRERCPDATVHPLEPADSPTLRTGHKVGKHRIQGISDEFVPPVVRLDELDRIVDVRDGDAIRMAQLLASRLGLGVGISSGANVVGALALAAEGGQGAVVATVLPDGNAKYLSTDLCREEPPREGDRTDAFEPTRVRVHPRAGLATG